MCSWISLWLACERSQPVPNETFLTFGGLEGRWIWMWDTSVLVRRVAEICGRNSRGVKIRIVDLSTATEASPARDVVSEVRKCTVF